MKIMNDTKEEVREMWKSVRFRIKPGEIKIVDNGLGSRLKYSGCVEIRDFKDEPEPEIEDDEIIDEIEEDE